MFLLDWLWSLLVQCSSLHLCPLTSLGHDQGWTFEILRRCRAIQVMLENCCEIASPITPQHEMAIVHFVENDA